MRSAIAGAFVVAAIGVPGSGIPSEVVDTPAGYTNPVMAVNAPDPTVVRAPDGTFFAYTTQSVHNGKLLHVPILRSDDLTSWSVVGDALPELPTWAMRGPRGDTWAPHVIAHRGRYLLYFSARRKTGSMAIGVATAGTLRGPFRPSGPPLLTGPRFTTIDPFVMPVENGDLYIYWGSGSQPIRAQRLSGSGLEVRGAARVVLRPSEELDYESLIEGPWITKHGGYFYLMYSGDRCCGDAAHYAVMVARSRSALGPFARYPGNPILEGNETFTNPGHNSTIEDSAGRDFIVYHAMAAGDPSRDRYLMLDRIDWVDGWPSINGGAGPSSSPQEPPDVSARPNLLLIVTDDQRGGLEVMPKTTRLFARHGRRLTNAFATTPLCCPSRASILTGRYAHNHAVLSNGEEDWRALDHSTTLEGRLHDAGYRTGIYGKFLNNWPLQRDPPYFDRWAVLPKVERSTAYYGGRWNVQGDIRKIERYSTTFVEDKAVSFLRSSERRDQRPWFLYLATPAPHRTFVAEPRYADAPVPPWEGNPAVFEADRSDKPAYVQASDATFERAKEIRRAQLRTLMSVDDLVGRVFRKIADLGESDTLAIFLSDNGYVWGEHGLNAKGVPYLPSVRVPMLLRWPGSVSRSADQRITANIDVTPTVLAAAGLPFDGDGRDLLDPSWQRDRLLLEYWIDPYTPWIPRWASTYKPSGQYVEYYDAQGNVTGTEFYDLANDPWQLDNLGSPPSPLWGEQLARDRSCTGSSCP